MGQILSHALGDFVPLGLRYYQDGAPVTGLAVRVALRQVTDNAYLDFGDNTWKYIGWLQKYRGLDEVSPGSYQALWDSAPCVTVRNILAAEFEVTTAGYAAQTTDMLIFGITEIVESSRWKIINNQMIFYAQDGVTPMLTFNLFDGSGLPAEINVKERIRV